MQLSEQFWVGEAEWQPCGLVRLSTVTEGPVLRARSQFPWLQAEEMQALLQAASSCTDLPPNRETKVNNRELNDKVNNREVLRGQADRAVCVSREHGYRLRAHP